MYSLRLLMMDGKTETCRVLFQNKINLRYCASGWFYYRIILRCTVRQTSKLGTKVCIVATFTDQTVESYFDPRQEKEFLSLSPPNRPYWLGGHPAPYSKGTGISFRKVRTGRQADPSSPPSTKVKKAPSYTFTVRMGTNISYFNDWIQRRRHDNNSIPVSASESWRWFVICK